MASIPEGALYFAGFLLWATNLFIGAVIVQGVGDFIHGMRFDSFEYINNNLGFQGLLLFILAWEPVALYLLWVIWKERHNQGR